MSGSFVETTRSAAITTITLNRPERRNALGIELLEPLVAAIAAAEADPTQRVLVLCGAGPVFCAGMDLNEATDPARAKKSGALIEQVLGALSGSRLVTIAVVQGAAVAGGAGLMSACDFALAATGAQIGYPEVRRGLVAGLVMTFLRRQVKERDARELLLTGELISADRAAAIGLVNRVVPPGELIPESLKIANAVLAGGPEAVAQTKKLWLELGPRPIAEDLAAARSFHLWARNSAEAIEGIAAFREKRPPQWAPK
ncbi:MAG: hypothetical protein JWM32_1700 [Verrucomicrobia bacterium]|nr:hypothetical protein [Verrucomicrobiota bacterium]